MRSWVVETARVVSSEAVESTMHRLVMDSPALAAAALPGQFVAFRVPDGATLLPRPFDLHFADAATGRIEVIFRVKGRGTRSLAGVPAGSEVEVHGPYGRPVEPLLRDRRHVALVGRGAGISPLAFIAARARGLGAEVAAYLSARTPSLLEPFERIVASSERVAVQTDLEQPGEVVTDRLAEDLKTHPIDAAFVVGSRRLALATGDLARRHGFTAYTFAECHMGCGFGHCKSCAVPTASGYLLACVDGPVVDLEEVSDAYWRVFPS